jgi:hypothetical protein
LKNKIKIGSHILFLFKMDLLSALTQSIKQSEQQSEKQSNQKGAKDETHKDEARKDETHKDEAHKDDLKKPLKSKAPALKSKAPALKSKAPTKSAAPAKPRKQSKCSACKQIGHNKRNCPNVTASETKVATGKVSRCSVCGELGHTKIKHREKPSLHFTQPDVFKEGDGSVVCAASDIGFTTLHFVKTRTWPDGSSRVLFSKQINCIQEAGLTAKVADVPVVKLAEIFGSALHGAFKELFAEPQPAFIGVERQRHVRGKFGSEKNKVAMCALVAALKARDPTLNVCVLEPEQKMRDMTKEDKITQNRATDVYAFNKAFSVGHTAEVAKHDVDFMKHVKLHPMSVAHNICDTYLFAHHMGQDVIEKGKPDTCSTDVEKPPPKKRARKVQKQPAAQLPTADLKTCTIGQIVAEFGL